MRHGGSGADEEKSMAPDSADDEEGIDKPHAPPSPFLRPLPQAPQVGVGWEHDYTDSP